MLANGMWNQLVSCWNDGMKFIMHIPCFDGWWMRFESSDLIEYRCLCLCVWMFIDAKSVWKWSRLSYIQLSVYIPCEALSCGLHFEGHGTNIYIAIDINFLIWLRVFSSKNVFLPFFSFVSTAIEYSWMLDENKHTYCLAVQREDIE